MLKITPNPVRQNSTNSNSGVRGLNFSQFDESGYIGSVTKFVVRDVFKDAVTKIEELTDDVGYSCLINGKEVLIKPFVWENGEFTIDIIPVNESDVLVPSGVEAITVKSFLKESGGDISSVDYQLL